MTDTKYADLHNHTQISDGELQLENVIKTAKQRGLSAIAITDHDKIHPELKKPIQIKQGIDVIRGIELRVQPESIKSRVDILAYGVDPTPELEYLLERVQKNRKERTGEILDLVESETGVSLEVKPTTNTGRPHIARAIDKNEELPYSYSGAFEELIGKDCPCYTSREIPSFEEGVKHLKDSSQFLSLAHPFRYPNPVQAMKLASNLDGIECIYPYNSNANIIPNADDIAVELFDLTATGGSDAHTKEQIATSFLMKSFYLDFLDQTDMKPHSIVNNS